MKLRYETARLLIYKVGWLMQENKSADMDAAMAKLYVSESFVRSSLDAVQLHGGSGFMTELELERELRDSVGSYSGTSEIQRNIIAPGVAALTSIQRVFEFAGVWFTGSYSGLLEALDPPCFAHFAGNLSQSTR